MSNINYTRVYASPAGLVFITVIILFALIPFRLGGSNVYTNHLLVPILFFLTIMDLVFRTKNPTLFSVTKGNFHAVFVFSFMWIILITYARNPMGVSSLGVGEGGLKFYWGWLCSFFTYFMIIYWANRNSKQSTDLLLVLCYVALGITALGAFRLMTGIEIPGLNTYAWDVNTVEGLGEDSGSTRIPFLGVYGQIGFFLVLMSIGFAGKPRLAVLGFFAVCIYLGGGRTILITTVAGMLVWLALNRKYILLLCSLILVGLSILLMPLINELAPTPQLKRLTNIGSLEDVSNSRSVINDYLIEEFKEHPIVGTGYFEKYELPLIRKKRRFITPDFHEKQLSAGSHGTHLQILKNLGLVGYSLFILMWLYPLYKLLPVASTKSNVHNFEVARNSQLCVTLISVFLIRMVTEGNGSDTLHYVFLAITTFVITQATTGVAPSRYGLLRV